MHRKYTEKRIWLRIDRFLFFAALILVVAFFVFNILFFRSGREDVAELLISSRYMELFGEETAEMLIREFLQQHPNLQIRFADEYADIIFFTDSELPGLLRSNALGAEPLIIPLVSYMDMLFYNTKLLKAAGFDRPPKTGVEFVSWARGAGGAGFAMGLNPNDRKSLSREIFSWIWAAGGDFWPVAEEGTSNHAYRPVFSSPITISTLHFLRELYRQGLMAPYTFSKTGAERLQEFAQGRIAMIVASTRDIPALRKAMGDNSFGVTAIPSVAAPGAGGFVKSGIKLSYLYAGISPDCIHLDKAREFLTFLAERNALIASQLEAVPGVIPGSPAGFSFGQHIAHNPHYLRAWDIFESSRIVHGFSKRTQAEEFEAIVLEELQAFFDERQNATVTANNIQNRWDALHLEDDR